ncbi:GcrA cell cycle regulator [Zhengella mangrovi]|uniref:GcrA cell cycle regulator n=1 Tax=Zhengella mangrovi TaxID=1982044 RepID=A0A2G1QJ11_9HYPH|nr:GcrA family cell cycle regulator [Zhengella mangrovi]PHP65479.1 GcrA cell cycle regulator [Zhengella mangrovi]
MNWTDERVELLKKLWAEGLSASQIASQLGGVSRNAVIGKVHRLKLSGRGRPTASPQRQKKSARPAAAAGKPATQRPSTSVPRSAPMTSGANALKADYDMDVMVEELPVIRSSEVVVPISRKLELTELTERTCKWPIGDPLAEDFHFCGNDSGESGPYCAYHARLAFQPASDRKRNRR